MKPKVRLFGVDKVEIDSGGSWMLHAPPENAKTRWKGDADRSCRHARFRVAARN